MGCSSLGILLGLLLGYSTFFLGEDILQAHCFDYPWDKHISIHVLF